MMDRLDARLVADLWFFRVAAESDSLGVAGELLSVTQSAVTQRLQRLEAHLGVKLFHRTARGLQMTAHGRSLLLATRTGFDGIAAALREIRAPSAAAAIRVSCVPSLALEWLMPRLPRFMAKHPGIEVEAFAEMHHLDRGRMALEGIDVGIRYGLEPPSGSVVAFDHPETLLPVSSATCRASGKAGGGVAPVVLLHDASPWLPLASRTDEWALWIEARGPPWGRPTQNLFYNLAQMAYRSAAAGTGVALGRALIVEPMLGDGRLVPALDAEPLGGVRYFVLAQAPALDHPARCFVEWLQAEMSA